MEGGKGEGRRGWQRGRGTGNGLLGQRMTRASILQGNAVLSLVSSGAKKPHPNKAWLQSILGLHCSVPCPIHRPLRLADAWKLHASGSAAETTPSFWFRGLAEGLSASPMAAAHGRSGASTPRAMPIS